MEMYHCVIEQRHFNWSRSAFFQSTESEVSVLYLAAEESQNRGDLYMGDKMSRTPLSQWTCEGNGCERANLNRQGGGRGGIPPPHRLYLPLLWEGKLPTFCWVNKKCLTNLGYKLAWTWDLQCCDWVVIALIPSISQVYRYMHEN